MIFKTELTKLNYLIVGEQKDAVLLCLGGLSEYSLDVLVPLVGRVALADLDLEELVLGHVGGEFGE